MLNIGLTAAQQKQFHDLLASHHSIYIRIQVLSLEHDYLSDISARLVDGQVTVDSTAEISRSLSLDLLDPHNTLHLDSDSPSNGALFADRMMRIIYVVLTPDGKKSYSTPVFTGPITKLERTGALLAVEAQGKDVLGMTGVWRAKTFKKGVQVTDVIRYILKDIMGETKLQIPNLKDKTARNISLGPDTVPWSTARNLASSLGYQLFYDGRGVARMRKKPSKSVFTFRSGKGGTVLTSPDAGFTMEGVINAVEVVGAKPKGKGKKKVRARVVAPRSHPLSPWKLGRNGTPRYLVLRHEDDSLKTASQCKKVAKEKLRRGLLQSVEVAYDTLVIPHLEEGDVVRLQTEEFAAQHNLPKFAIPLTANGVSTIGYVRNVKPNRRAIRARRSNRARGKGKNS